MKLRSQTLLFFFLTFFSLLAQAQSREHWVATWGTAQQLIYSGPTAPRPPQNPPPPVNLAIPAMWPSVNNQTVRMIVRASLGGPRVRVRLVNAFGSSPLTIGATHLALRSKDAAIIPASDRALTFSGRAAATIPPGAVLFSDPVELTVAPLAELAISLYLPKESTTSAHLFGEHTAYLSKEGDFTGSTEIADATTSLSYYWLAGVDVLAPANAATIITLGDSITDGHGSMPNTDHTWPAYLTKRLQSDKRAAHLGVVNVGISGNQVLRDGGGVLGGMSALARLERDVLTQPGAQFVLLMEGINDISGRTRQADADTKAVTEDLLAAYRQIIARVRAQGLKIIGCTLTPFGNARAFTEKGETVRQAVNQWIRTSGAFDSVVDFDAATRDPNNPQRFREAFHAGDWLHPGDAGYEAMANAINLTIFAPKKR
ncbi:MAG: SGNH/GDSL hydrolase family protein [Blastocatellia bacterium]